MSNVLVFIEQRDGKTYYHIVDYDSLRSAFGRLLAEVMRIKAEGDVTAARKLVDTYGLQVDVRLRDEIQNRVRHLDLPAYSAFVMPRLEPVNDANGQLVDVTVGYPLDLAAPMLEYSSFTKQLRKIICNEISHGPRLGYAFSCRNSVAGMRQL